ncbi:hypothetical protein [Aquihabitans sp. McL0605]|uniref:hypothetical protein n=1 Tax=Aquihabitans sp. McL0605 TaxID=3415671 RepID=UPI003CF0687A
MMTEPASDAAVAAPSLARRAWSAPLWAHLAILLIGLVGVVLLTSPQGTLVADDGSYQLQLRALHEGSWDWQASTASLDPAGTHYPIVNADRTATGWAPIAKHPAWPWLANAVSPLTGVEHAYDVLGVLGVLGLATAAWLLAAEHDRRWSRWAFWLAGTAPVALTAAVPWAHAAASAAAGFAVLGAVRLVRRPPSAAAVLLIVAGVAGAVLLRTEGLLLAGAVGVGLAVGGRQAGRTWRWSLGAGGAVVALALAVMRFEDRWIRSITTGASSTLHARTGSGIQTSGFVDARYQGAVRSMVDSARPGMTLLLGAGVVLAAVTAGLVAAGRPRLLGLWKLAAGLSIVFLLIRVLWLSNYPISGILAAWPIAVAGLASALPVAWRRVRVEVTIAAVYAAAVLATQYADGGGGSWGARFFSLGTVPIVIIVAVGIERLLQAEPRPSASLITVPRLLVVLMVVPVLAGLAVVHDVQSGTASLYAWVDQQVEGVAVTPSAELPRMMWHQDVPWLVVDDAKGSDDLAQVLRSLGDNGPEVVSVVVLDRDLPSASAAVADQGTWSEVSRDRREGLTVLVLHR